MRVSVFERRMRVSHGVTFVDRSIDSKQFVAHISAILKKKKRIHVVYTYDVEYEFEQHLKEVKDDLRQQPSFGVSGAGVVSDGQIGSYSSHLKGKGKILT